MAVLRHCTDEYQLSMRLLATPSTNGNEFSPTWTYWLSLPRYKTIIIIITVDFNNKNNNNNDNNDKNNNYCNKIYNDTKK